MLNTLSNALSGNYVNFGVFSLYNDQALQNSLDVSLQMCLQIPLTDILAYVKLSRAYFAFIEILFRNHLDVLCGLDSGVFLQLLKTNSEGLQSSGNSATMLLQIYSIVIILHAVSGFVVFLFPLYRADG